MNIRLTRVRMHECGGYFRSCWLWNVTFSVPLLLCAHLMYANDAPIVCMRRNARVTPYVITAQTCIATWLSKRALSSSRCTRTHYLGAETLQLYNVQGESVQHVAYWFSLVYFMLYTVYELAMETRINLNLMEMYGNTYFGVLLSIMFLLLEHFCKTYFWQNCWHKKWLRPQKKRAWELILVQIQQNNRRLEGPDQLKA